MKNIILLFLLTFASMTATAQYGVDNIFRKYKNDKGVLAWQFEGDISSMLKTKNGSEIKSSIEGVDFVLFSNGGDISANDQAKLKERIQNDQYEMLVQARDDGKKIKIMGIEDGDKIRKVFATITMEEMTAYFFLTGEIFLEDLNNIEYDGLMKNMGL